MNHAKLRALLDALEAASKEVRADLEKTVDPIVVHIYRSRRAYDAACGKKGNKYVEQVAFTSLVKARELGYRGPAEAWREILRCWPQTSDKP